MHTLQSNLTWGTLQPSMPLAKWSTTSTGLDECAKQRTTEPL